MRTVQSVRFLSSICAALLLVSLAPGVRAQDQGGSIPRPQCSDRFDNDGDGLIDFPADPGCASAGDNDERNTDASFAVELSANPDPVPCGGVIIYNIRVQNVSLFRAPVTVSQLLPTGTQLLRATQGAQLLGNRVVWRGTLRSDQVSILATAVRVDGATCNRGELRSVATAGTDSVELFTTVIPRPQPNRPQCADGQDNDGDGRADGQDPGCTNPADNDEEDHPREATFAVEVSDEPDPAVCGGLLRYSIRVHNLSVFSTSASPVTVVQELPPNTLFTRASHGGILQGNRIVWRGTLRPDQVATILSEVRVLPAACNRSFFETRVGAANAATVEATRLEVPPVGTPGNPVRPACNDGVDNDFDADIDYPLDLGCLSPSDTQE